MMEEKIREAVEQQLKMQAQAHGQVGLLGFGPPPECVRDNLRGRAVPFATRCRKSGIVPRTAGTARKESRCRADSGISGGPSNLALAGEGIDMDVIGKLGDPQADAAALKPLVDQLTDALGMLFDGYTINFQISISKKKEQ